MVEYASINGSIEMQLLSSSCAGKSLSLAYVSFSGHFPFLFGQFSGVDGRYAKVAKGFD